jgi:hypothetical protein
MKRKICTLCMAIVALPNIAHANDGPPPVAPTIVDATVAEVDPLTLTDENLGDQRGGFTIVSANQTLSAISTGSVLNGDFTAGAVNLSDNALSNFNGFGNVVINTGAQNSLQAGMNITINFGQ